MKSKTPLCLVLPTVTALVLGGCNKDQSEDATAMTAPIEPAGATVAVAAPVAEKRPHEMVEHGHSRNDEYYWLRDDDRKDPDVIAYLESENAYTEAMLADTEAFKNSIYEEMVARIKQDDSSVPARSGDYWYYSRFSEGQEYPVYARRKGSVEGPEEVLLDVNVMAEGHEYFNVGSYEVSDNDQLLAWSEDSVSRRQYVIRARNLATGEVLADRIENTTGSIAWAADNQTFFYIRKDPQTLLGYQVYRHRLGTEASEDVLVYEESDTSFYMSIYRSKSRDWIYIHLGATVSDEVRMLPANEPEGEFQVFHPREDGHEYSVDDLDGRFFVLTNWDAQNFRVMETTLANSSDRSSWKEFMAHDENVLIHGIEPFSGYLVISQRSNALRKLRVIPLDGQGKEFFIESDEPAYTMYVGQNEEMDSTILRYGYTSMTTPFTVYDYDMHSGQRTLMKRAPVLGDFDPDHYATERISITARDGTEVPVSLVYRKPFELYADRPLLVYGYGSYGSSRDPSFSIANLSLLDRGFVYAIAHVRGGQEMGRKWYEDGKMFNKMNTFTDFIDVTRGLVEKGYGDSKRVFAFGGSAGGLLMGAVINLAPELYRGVIAAVPFVDVVTTMLDESIPLTTNEFNEWGNPKNKAEYEYMLSYSPYDQVKAQDYPNLLVTTGLHDSQVQYFEPAKWVARLRATKTDQNRLLLRTDMEVGHGGSSGRFKRYEDRALMWSFVLDLADIRE